MAGGSSAHGGFARFAGVAYVSLNSDMKRRLEFFQGGDETNAIAPLVAAKGGPRRRLAARFRQD